MNEEKYRAGRVQRNAAKVQACAVGKQALSAGRVQVLVPRLGTLSFAERMLVVLPQP
jgi:hypothetical protein